MKYLKDPKAFAEHSNDMNDVYSSNKTYNPRKKRKVFIVFDYMVADMISNKKGFTQ